MKELFELYNLHIGGTSADFHLLVSLWGVSGIQVTHPDPIIDEIQKIHYKRDILKVKIWILNNMNYR